ncbi:MAG TPA: right-handed parallel beta-helix repeat-containing protein [Candidatus Paceibacterota bacterium]|nr:right-handed parallel beta-helix repeat-containing protein [Verrucomicrobiota bacterium]HRY51899.1 right-handed parallel beta-helix repeat-containing protein [Candidatus Paceibacterota bacterium]
MRWFLALNLTILGPQVLPALGAEDLGRDSVQVILSTQDGSQALASASPLRLGPRHETQVPIITLDLSRKRQSILGFGGSLDHATCENLSKLSPERRDEVMTRLMDPAAGIGMNLMRVCIGTSDFVDEPYYTYNDLPEGQTDPDLVRFSIDKDRAYVLPAIQLALKKNPQLLLFASPWSPPAWMKTSGKLGTGRVKPEFYPAYARYLLKFVRAYEAEGVPIHAITVQNEPQHQDRRYPTTLWSAEEQRDFIRDHLGPLFAEHQVKPLIWCWDHNWNLVDFPRTVLADPKAARFVDGTAFHHYEGRVEAQSALLAEFPEKHVYFTEGSVFRIRGAVGLIDILRHGARSYNAWVLMLDEHRKPNRGPHSASATCVERLDDGTVRYNFDYSMYGQFTKYIRRGAVRIESSRPEAPDLANVAFLDPAGRVVLVAANAGRGPQRFAVVCGARMFEAELPAESLATFLWEPKESARAEFFVSPGGSDDYPGTEQKPFATLERARDALRQARQAGNLPAGEVTIWLRGGDYPLRKAFELSGEDSGTPEAPVVWRGYRNERARLLGGRVITGFRPVTDGAARARLDATARDNVLVTDLRTQGIEDYGTIRSRGFSRPPVPAHGELFFGGLPMTLARWPNPGTWEHIKDFPKEAGNDDGHGTTMGALTAGFFHDTDRPARWKSRENIWVHGYWAYDWANSYERVAELDLARRFIRTAEPYGNYGFNKQQRFYFLNILEEIDEPGEWFVDARTGLLYFWPPSSIASGEVMFSLLEQPLVKLKDARCVTLRGLGFEATRGNAIEITGGEGNRVVGCLLRNIGNTAVTIAGGTNHEVLDCDIFDTGDGGVTLSGGDRQTLAPAHHFVENCHFQRQGRWSKCYVPAILMSGVGHRAAHNLIHDHPHAAILFGGNEHIIEFNDIHHIALETGDVGAIYTGRDYTVRGNRIRYNYIHETGGVGMGSMGVYMDDCVSGTEVFGNVFHKVHWAMFIGGGRDHRVENNLFVDCDPAVRADGRSLDPSPVWRNMVNQFMRERLKSVPPDLYRERYPAIKSLDAYYGPPGGPEVVGDAFKGIPPEGNLIARNVCVGKWKEITWRAEEKHFEIRDNFVTNDRNQVGGANSGFRLPEQSPAWKLGFQPIPFHQIGLQATDDRMRLDRMR